MTNDGQYNKILSMVSDIATLTHKLGQAKQLHLQAMLAITHALGGELRITAFDYRAAIGQRLYVYTDPATGDQVYTTKKEEADDEQAPD